MCTVCVGWTGSRPGQDSERVRLLSSLGPGRDIAFCKAIAGSLRTSRLSWMAFVNFFKKLQIFNKICSIYLTRRIDSKPLGGIGRDLLP